MSEELPFLIIVNFIPPYDLEVASVLAAPAKARVRFRYQTKYAPTIRQVSSLIGREGTILLRDRGSGWFMPLRRCRAVNVRLVGDVIYITAELSKTAALSNESDQVKSQVDRFNDLIRREIGSYSNTPDTDLRNLVLIESGDVRKLLTAWQDASDSDDVTHWGNVVGLIDAHFPALDMDFFRVVSLQDPAHREIGIVTRSSDLYGFAVRPGQEYSLQILQRTYTGKRGDSSVASTRYLELIALDEDVRLRQSQIAIIGKYDISTFWLYVSKTATQAPKQIQLSVVRPSREQRYGVELPMIVRRQSREIISRFALLTIFFLALVAYVASQETADSITKFLTYFHFGTTISRINVEKVAVVIMLLSGNVSGITKWIAERGKLG